MLPVTPFALEEASAAFRHMMKARQIGKIVVTHQRTVPGPSFGPMGSISSPAAFPASAWRRRNGWSRAARNMFRCSDAAAPRLRTRRPSRGGLPTRGRRRPWRRSTPAMPTRSRAFLAERRSAGPPLRGRHPRGGRHRRRRVRVAGLARFRTGSAAEGRAARGISTG